MNISVFNKTKLGYSHIKENKICQDYSLSYSAPDNLLFIAIVSDGHGGKTYCRSDKGSRFACEIAMEAIKEMSGLATLLQGKSAQVPARKQKSKPNEDDTIVKFEDVYSPIKDIDPTFERLFQYIYFQWIQRVESDWKENPPTTEELQLLGNKEIVKAYGATLMAFVQTPDYWFGFHIGDGKCLACDEKGKWFEPILWDSECFLNATTSLCGSEAYKSFRYSFSGKGDFPIAVMLGTDGIDDSWGDKLTAYYTSILEDISNLGIEKAKISLSDSLPDLSKNSNTQDDVSVAWIVNTEAIETVLSKLLLLDNRQETEMLNTEMKKMKDLLRIKTEEQNEDKNKYKSDLNSLNEQNKKYAEEINLSKSKLQQLEQKKDELEENNKQLKQYKEGYEKLKQDIEEISMEKTELSKSLKEKENEIVSLNSENKELSKSLSKTNEEIEKFKEQTSREQNLVEDENKKEEEVETKQNPEKEKIKPEIEVKKKKTTTMKSKIFIFIFGIILGIVSTVGVYCFADKQNSQEKKTKQESTNLNDKQNEKTNQADKKNDTVNNAIEE